MNEITNPEDLWDKRFLGCNISFVGLAPESDDSKVDSALDICSVSIRVQNSLIEELKVIAQSKKINYYFLIRQVLQQFVDEHQIPRV